MESNEIFFKINEKKTLIATLGNADGNSVHIKTSDKTEKLRLVSPDSKNALPIRIKMNDKIYALGSFPEGLVFKVMNDSSVAGVDEYNKSYVYGINNNSLELIAILDFRVTSAFFVAEQNFYLAHGSYYEGAAGSRGLFGKTEISFNGIDWILLADGNVNRIQDVIYKNGLVRILVFYVSYSNGNSYKNYVCYEVKDERIEKKFSYISSYNYKAMDFDNNLYFYNLVSKTYYKSTNGGSVVKIAESDIPNVPSKWRSEEKGFDYTQIASFLNKTGKYTKTLEGGYGQSLEFGNNGKITILSIWKQFTVLDFESDSEETFYDYFPIKKNHSAICVFDGNTSYLMSVIGGFFFSRINNNLFKIGIDDNNKISIYDLNGNITGTIIAGGSNKQPRLVVTSALETKYSVFNDFIEPGTFSIQSFYNTLSNYIGENSYRVVASDFTITNGNFSISVLAGQRIWLCSEGESPNYAKAIRFVDDDSDYSGNVPDYVGGYQNYDFYGSGNTGFAKVFKAKGRYGSYYDVSNYEVTVTGNISFK